MEIKVTTAVSYAVKSELNDATSH